LPLQAQTTTLAAERRRKRISTIVVLRRALPLLAVGLLGLCAAQIVANLLDRPTAQPAPAQASAMIEPRFSGSSSKGSFRITGRTGLRDETAGERILIAEPVLTLRSQGGGTRKATAKSGVYDESAHSMLLTGDVRIDDGSGGRFAAKEARIDTRTGVLSGQVGMRFEGAAATVESRSFVVEEEGERMILKGGVRGRLNPKN
jgi:lipopolysaccharide export system protein LptC